MKFNRFTKMCICLILFSLFGCGGNGKKEVRLILDWLPNPNHIAIYSGVAQGFFEEEGIPLRIIKILDPSDSIPYLTSKQVDVCLSYMPHTIQAKLRGAKVIPIGILIKEPLNSIIFRKDVNITHPQDLNNKVIGYCVDGHRTGFLDNLLKINQVVPAKKRNVSFDLISTLATGNVDAIYGAYWNIELENFHSLGIEADYFSLPQLGVPNYYELIFLAERESPYASKKFTQAFQRALQKSIDFSRKNPDAAFQHYIEANPNKTLAILKWEKNAWKKTLPLLAENQDFSRDVWNSFVKWLIDHQLIENREEAYLSSSQVAHFRD